MTLIEGSAMRKVRYLVVLTCLTLASCNTLRGGPEQPFATKDVWDKNAVKTVVDALSGNVANTPTEDDCVGTRNINAFKMIAYVDVNYLQYRHTLIYDKQHTQAITDGLQLLMTIAGGLTDSTGVKDNYLAGIALLTGGEAIYDKSYLFEKTAPALVAQMDASRKQRLVELLAKLDGLQCSKYPGLVALSDILDYYYIGTLSGAIASTQKDADSKDTQAQILLNALNAQRIRNALEE